VAYRNWFRGSYRDVRSGLLFRLSLKQIIRRNAASATESQPFACEPLRRPAMVFHRASSRLQLVVAASGNSRLRCNLGSAQGAWHWLGAPSTPPRRAVSNFCQDYKPHSVGTATPSRASGVQFPFPSSLSFFPTIFLFLHRSYYDYDSELISTVSAATKARLVANCFGSGSHWSSDER